MEISTGYFVLMTGGSFLFGIGTVLLLSKLFDFSFVKQHEKSDKSDLSHEEDIPPAEERKAYIERSGKLITVYESEDAWRLTRPINETYKRIKHLRYCAEHGSPPEDMDSFDRAKALSKGYLKPEDKRTVVGPLNYADKKLYDLWLKVIDADRYDEKFPSEEISKEFIETLRKVDREVVAAYASTKSPLIQGSRLWGEALDYIDRTIKYHEKLIKKS